MRKKEKRTKTLFFCYIELLSFNWRQSIEDINQKGIKKSQLFYPDIKSINHIKGNKIGDIIPDFNRSICYKYVSDTVKEKKTQYWKNFIRKRDGKETYFNINYEPVPGLNGEVREIAIVLVDVISEVKSNIAMERI